METPVLRPPPLAKNPSLPQAPPSTRNSTILQPPPLAKNPSLPQAPPSTRNSTLPQPPGSTKNPSIPQPPPSTRSSIPKAPPSTRNSTLPQAPPSTKNSSLPQAPSSSRSSFPKPPPSTKSSLPKAPTPAASSQEETKDDKYKMPDMDDYFANKGALQFQDDDKDLSEADIRAARQAKLRMAQKLKENLQAELARNEQQKMANMTPEEQISQLAEKKRQEDEKQKQNEDSAKLKEDDERLSTEVLQLKKEVKSLQNDVDQTQQKSKKLQEIEGKLSQLSEQSRSQQLNFELELSQVQEEHEQSSQVLEETQSKARQYSSLKSTIEQQSDTVIQKHVLQEKQKSQIQTSLLETNLTLEKYKNQLVKLQLQLSAGNQEQLEEEELLIELHFEQIEKLYRKKEEFKQKLVKLNSNGVQEKLKQVQLRKDNDKQSQQQVQFKKYKSEIESNISNQSTELQLLKQIEQTEQLIINLSKAFHDSYRQLMMQESQSLHQRNEIRGQDLVLVAEITSVELENTQLIAGNQESQKLLVEIDEQLVVDNQRHQEVNNQFEVQNVEHLQVSEEHQKQTTEFQTESQTYTSEYSQAIQGLNNQILECDTKLAEMKSDILVEQSLKIEMETKQIELSEHHPNLLINKDKQEVRKEKNLKVKLVKDSLLSGMVIYAGECSEHHGSGKEHHSELKVVRLAVLGEAIQRQMDDDERHRQADTEINDLQLQIQQHTDDVTEYQKSSTAHEEVVSRLAVLELAHREDQEKGDLEHQDHIVTFEATSGHLDEHLTALALVETEQLSLQLSHTDLQHKHSLINTEHHESSQHLQGHHTDHTSHSTQHEEHDSALKLELAELATMQLERDEILGAMTESNPEFVKQTQDLHLEIDSLREQLLHNEQELHQIEREIVETDRAQEEIRVELEVVTAEEEDQREQKNLKEQEGTNFRDHQFRAKEESERLSGHRDNQDALLAGMITYMEECNEHHDSGKEHHEELKVVRLVVLGEAIKGQMDDDERHKQADSEIDDLQQQIQQHTDDVSEYQKSQVAHEEVTTRLTELELAHREDKEKGDLEHQDHIVTLEATDIQLNEHLTALEVAETEQASFSQSHSDIQDKHNLIDSEHHDSTQQLKSHHTEHTSHSTQHEEHDSALKLELAELATLQLERDGLLESMTESNPEFVKQTQDLHLEIDALREQSHQKEKELDEIESEIEDADRQQEEIRGELEVATVGESDHQLKKTSALETGSQFGDQQLRHKEENDLLSGHRDTHDALLAGMVTYMEECDTHHGSGKQHHEELKVVRLAMLGEAIKGQMDDENWHKHADSEIDDLQLQIQQHTDDVTEYQKSSTAHEEVTTRLAELEFAHREDQEKGDLEHQDHIVTLETTGSQLDEHLAVLALAETEQALLSQSHSDIQDKHNLIDSEHTDSTQQLEGHHTDHTSHSTQHEEHDSILKLELAELATIQLEHDNLLEGMTESNPEFVKQTQDLHLEINSLREQNHQKDIELDQIELEIVENDQKQIEVKSQLEAATVEDEDLTQSKHLLEQEGTKFRDHQFRAKEESERLSLDKNNRDALLAGMVTYMAECDDHHDSVTEHHEGLKVERIEVITGLILLKSQQAAAPSVGQKKRHARNSSMIGQLASSTFEVDDSALSQSQVEEQVLNALQVDSQGTKVTIVEAQDVDDAQSLRNIEELSEESDKDGSPTYGVVGPSSSSNENHGRQLSAGSVQVAMTVETIAEIEHNKTPTVPSVAKEFRPSIFDMKKQGQQRGGSFRATAYDKAPLSKRIGQALLGKIGAKRHTDDSILGDLLVCLLTQKQMMMLHSDFEICKGYELFKQMYEMDPKCHEALFGLGRINYIQGRYEVAEKMFIKSYEAKRDFVYRVWLGYTQLQLFFSCTVDNPKRMTIAQNAFQNLDRCSKEPRVGLYGNFALIYLSLALKGIQKLKGLQDPSYYQQLIQKKDGRYEAMIASAVIHLEDDPSSGLNRLNMLVSEDGRPHAHYVLIRHYLRVQDYEKARHIAEEAYQKITDYESFQERLALILLYCKCLQMDNQPHRALVYLQMQYTEQPHFSSLLYAYGKCIVTQKALYQFLPAGISALQEVQRISCQVRSAKASYWLAEAAKIQNKPTLQGIYQHEYLNGIKQVVKNGPMRQKPILQKIDVTVQIQLLQQMKKYEASKPQPIGFTIDPTLTIEDQIQVPLQDVIKQSPQELIQLCQNISSPRDQQMYKAIALYRLLKDFKQAESLFTQLVSQFPDDLEIHLENIKFLRACINESFTPQSNPANQARDLVQLLRQKADTVSGDIWAAILINCAKLIFKVTSANDEAFEWLLQLKLCTPIIDQQLAGVALPGSIEKYLPSEELSHIDFQSNGTIELIVDQQSSEFRPQDDYDESNKFFMQTKFAQYKLQVSPLATLSVAEIRDQERHKGDQLFYFGAVQTDLAYEAEEQSHVQLSTSKYYKSATPLIAVIKYLQHLKRVNNQNVASELDFSQIKDTGFCVRSCPEFLLVVAKMCLKLNQYIDLAVQCLLEYHQSLSYYRGFDKYWHVKDMEAKLLLALVVKKMSTDQAADNQVVQVLTEQVGAKVKAMLKEQLEPEQQYHLKKASKLLSQL